jgi:hypothetical protein
MVYEAEVSWKFAITLQIARMCRLEKKKKMVSEHAKQKEFAA